MKTYDVIVIGAGPGGCSAATIIAKAGIRVLILEKERFKRYHIGESLLPYCYFPLSRMGLIEELENSNFTPKLSVQFVNDQGKVTQPFYFDEHMDHPASKTWQVNRDDFDAMLLNKAVSEGAELIQPATVKRLCMEGDRCVGVEATLDGQTQVIEASCVIDASGRNAVTASQFGWRNMDQQLKKIAIWSYFKGATRDPGKNSGATTICYVNGKQWFWYIPLKDGIVSVGLVGDKAVLYEDSTDIQEIFEAHVKQNPWIESRLEGATRQKDYELTGDFSYRATHCAGNGYVLVGDAFAFLDPVFSSGVFLALYGGVIAADAIVANQHNPSINSEHFSDYSQKIRNAIEAMRVLVYAFYDPEFSFGKVLKQDMSLQGDLTDCLIGHVEKDFSRLFNAFESVTPAPPSVSFGDIA